VERRQFQTFLVRSLELLAREKAAVHARLCAALDGMVLAMRIDGEGVAVGFSPLPCVTSGARRNADVKVRSSRRAILDVIDGNVTLENAVLEDRIVLLGSVPALVRFHDGLRVYLNGAVRAPGFAGLLDEYVAAGRGRTARSSSAHGEN
jgi:hypothetical protein